MYQPGEPRQAPTGRFAGAASATLIQDGRTNAVVEQENHMRGRMNLQTPGPLPDPMPSPMPPEPAPLPQPAPDPFPPGPDTFPTPPDPVDPVRPPPPLILE